MNKLKLLGGGAVLAGTMAIATAGAFAATPMGHPGMLSSNGNLSAIMARGGMAKHSGKGPLVKVQASLAQVLGLTPDQLKSELQTKTLDQIAADHGMTRQQLLTAALQNAGFSDAQIQKIMNAMGKIPHDKAGLPKLR